MATIITCAYGVKNTKYTTTLCTYHIVIRFQGDFEHISLLCLNKEEEHMLQKEREKSKPLSNSFNDKEKSIGISIRERGRRESVCNFHWQRGTGRKY